MGIGIFLGLCFCGFIYLYTQTKDRWNWSKLCKILVYVVITPIVLGLASVTVMMMGSEPPLTSSRP